MKSEMIKFRNDTGGLIFIPQLATDSPLEGAFKAMTKVENGKTFKTECQNGVPVNPSLKVMLKAKSDGIALASDPVPPVAKGVRSRSIK